MALAFIIAGPGSGKTFTLVERIVYLITHKGCCPRVTAGCYVHRQGRAELTLASPTD